MSSAISHDGSEKGNGDDEFVHVDCNSEMFTMSSEDQYDESLLVQCDSGLTYLEMCVCFSQEDQDRTIAW